MSETIPEPPRLKALRLSRNLVPMTEQQKRTPTQITDPTGRTVAANLRTLRERRNLSTYAVSALLKRADRPITPSAIAKIERAQRRVDVGDLMALAAVLNVTPSALLLPLDDDPNHTVAVTGAGDVPADVAWDWMDGERPLRRDGDPKEMTDLLEYDLYSRPPSRRRNWGGIRGLVKWSESDTQSLAYQIAQQLRSEERGRGDG